jgi:folate-binding protein YgfZ
MDSTTLPPEVGLDRDAVSHTKGCYVGQEVLGRLRTRGRVAKRLVGYWLEGQGDDPPGVGAPVLLGEKAVGQLTSVVRSPRLGGPIALGYLRREVEIPVSGLRAGVSGGWKARASVLPLQSFT